MAYDDLGLDELTDAQIDETDQEVVDASPPQPPVYIPPEPVVSPEVKPPELPVDPVLSANSLDELVKDPKFNPVAYALANPKALEVPDMIELLSKVTTARKKERGEHPVQAAWDVVKGSAGAAWDMGKQGVAAAKALLDLKFNDNPHEKVRDAAELAAALESGTVQAAEFAGQVASLPVKLVSPAVGRVMKAAGVAPTPAETEEADKEDFLKAVHWAKQTAEIGRGQGSMGQILRKGLALGLVSSAGPQAVAEVLAPGSVPAKPGEGGTGYNLLTAPDIRAEALTERGPELAPRPDIIAGESLVLNPINAVPFGAATGKLGQLARGALQGVKVTSPLARVSVETLAAAGSRVAKLGESFQPSNVAARVGQGVGRAMEVAGKAAGAQSLPLVGGAAAALSGGGVPAGVIAGVGIKAGGKAVEVVGRKLVSTATRLQKRQGALFQVMDAGLNAPVTGAAKGFLSAVPLAALVDDPEAQKSILGGGLLIGGAAGLGVGAARGTLRAGQAAGVSVSRQRFAAFQGKEVESAPYGTEFDAVHDAAMNRADPVTRTVVSRVREFLRNLPVLEGAPARAELYLVEDPHFKDITGLDASGFTVDPVLAPDGTQVQRIFINRSGSKGAVFHEASHALELYMQQFYPDAFARIQKEIAGIPERNRQAFADYYDYLQQRNNPETPLPDLTPTERDREIFAEMVGAYIRGSELNGLPDKLRRTVAQTVGNALETLGIYKPGTPSEGATVVPASATTPTGLTPSFRVAGAAAKGLSATGAKIGTPGPVESPKGTIYRPTVSPLRPLGRAGKPVAAPGAPAAPGRAPRGSRRTLYATPAQREMLQSAEWTDDTSWEAVSAKADELGLTDQQKDVLEQLRQHRQEAGAASEVGPVQIDYLSVEGAAGKPATRSSRRAAQEEAYVKEAMGALPEDVRATFSKLILPYRLVVRPKEGGGANVNILGMSPDKVVGNAILAAREAARKGLRGDLVPYEMSGEALTDAGVAEFAQDVVAYTQSQANGYTGAGETLTVPPTYKGQLPEVNPNFTPTKLGPAKANFINLTMGIEPPKTPRWSAARRNPATGELITRPANVEAADLAAANARPLEGASFSKGEFKSPQGEKFPIVEPNPLRADYARAGIDLSKILSEVTEEVNLEHVQSPIVPRPELGFRQPSTGMVTAGFMPKVGDTVQLTGPDGKPYKFRFDGRVNYEPMVAGTFTQLTALEPGPGNVPKGGTFTFGEKTLGEEKGYKFPDLTKEGAAMPTVNGNAIRKSETLKADLEAMKAGKSFGTTINLDGTPWIPPAGAKLDIVSMASKNFPRKNLTTSAVARLVHANGEFFTNVPEARPGLGNLDTPGPNGEPMSSIDLNVAVDQVHRENTIAFAKANGQESIYDTATGELVPTGGNGQTVITDVPEMIAAAKAVVAGQPHTFAAKSPSGALVVRKSGAAAPTGTPPKPEGLSYMSDQSWADIVEMRRNWTPEKEAERRRTMEQRTPTESPRNFNTASGPLAGGDLYRHERSRAPAPPLEEGSYAPKQSALAEDRPLPAGRKGYSATEYWVGNGKTIAAPNGHLAEGERVLGRPENSSRKDSSGAGMVDLYNEMAEKGYLKTTVRGEDVWVDSRPEASGVTKWNDVPRASRDELKKIADEKGGWVYFNGDEVYQGARPGRTEGAFAPKRAKAVEEDYSKYQATGTAEKDTTTGWILPDRSFHELAGQEHEDFLYNNADELNRKFKTNFPSEGGPDVAERLKALNAGFIRMRNYGGGLTIEAARDKWTPSVRRKVLERVQDAVDDLDSVQITLLNRKGDAVVSQRASLFNLDSVSDKLDALPAALTGEAGSSRLEGAAMATLPDLTSEFDLGLDVAAESLKALAKAKARRAKSMFEEALPLRPVLDAEGNARVDSKTGGPAFHKEAYDFTGSPVWKRLKRESKTKNPLPGIAKMALPEVRTALKDPKVSAGVHWYEDANNLIREKLGEDSDMFSQLLAATSPRQSPEVNFSQAFDYFNQLKSGELDAKIERYRELLDEWQDPDLDWASLAADYRRVTHDTAGQVNRRTVQNWILDREGILPRMSDTGEQFGINSRAALDVVARRWLDVNGGEKTSAYYSNLTGNSVNGTIDVWAARFLHRLLNEGEKERWRILPPAESAVGPEDYAAGQSAFQAMAKAAKLTTPELQGLLWFWEKQIWEQNGWTRGAGSEKQSYNPLLKRIERSDTGKLSLKPEDLKPKKDLDLFGG